MCTEDRASVNIHERLLEEGDLEKISQFNGRDVHWGHGYLLYQAEGLHLYLDDIDSKIRDHYERELSENIGISSGTDLPLDLLVFLSKHRSEMEKQSLTVHPPGNYLSADHGGVPGYLPPSSPRYMSSALRILYREKKLLNIKDQTTYEVTHHGPMVHSPCFFIEIGSTEDRWGIPELGSAIAKTLLSEDLEDQDHDVPVAIGIGGGHYAPRFTDRAMRKKFDFGHMVPDYILRSTDQIEDVLRLAWEATPGVKGAFVHRSGKNKEQQQDIEAAMKELDIPELQI